MYVFIVKTGGTTSKHGRQVLIGITSFMKTRLISRKVISSTTLKTFLFSRKNTVFTLENENTNSFTLNYLYRIREHNYSSPDAAIHIANLMSCKFDIEQAKVISIRVLDELSEFRATEDYMMHLKRQCETYISPDNFLI